MNTMLRGVVENGTAARAILRPHVVAGKTGTTSAYRDAWFVGYTAHLVASVWFGNDGGAPTRQMTGGTLPAATWREIMALAHHGLPPRPLPGRGLVASGPARSPIGSFQEVPRSEPHRRRGFDTVPGGGFSVVSGR